MRSVGYDEDQSILEIEFIGGEVYRYADVPIDVYRELMGSASKGRYFSAHIRNSGFEYRRIE